MVDSLRIALVWREMLRADLLSVRVCVVGRFETESAVQYTADVLQSNIIMYLCYVPVYFIIVPVYNMIFSTRLEEPTG